MAEHTPDELESFRYLEDQLRPLTAPGANRLLQVGVVAAGVLALGRTNLLQEKSEAPQDTMRLNRQLAEIDEVLRAISRDLTQTNITPEEQHTALPDTQPDSFPGMIKEEAYRNIAYAMRRTYKKAKLHQMDLARSLGVSQSTISSWVNAQSKPNVLQLMYFEEACGVPIGTVLHHAGLISAEYVGP